jgi:hypothetical protein|tara:strand:+ start:326 stop:454 length:129 start_codon:yes stop_codon:yes gene_type:complete
MLLLKKLKLNLHNQIDYKEEKLQQLHLLHLLQLLLDKLELKL